MISVEEADRLLNARLYQSDREVVPLSSAMGRYLADDVCADRDFPPFDRVAMDGIAIRHADYLSSGFTFEVIGARYAGQPMLSMGEGQVCVEVMTGVMLPADADTVVRYEDFDLKDGKALIRTEIRKGQNIHFQGSDARAGDVVLKSGTCLSAADIPVLASVGAAAVPVKSLPRVAVVSTGDELVAAEEIPAPHQIRSSNRHAIAAGLSTLGIVCTLVHLRDDQEDRHRRLEELLESNDIVVLTGGVSKGKADWVPEALAQAGVRKIFHQVSQRPGKPFWYGFGDNVFVFAFPGNPVSTFLCLYRYLLPWLKSSFGENTVRRDEAVLAEDFTFQPGLTLFLQVRVQLKNGTLYAQPVPGGGSGDFINLTKVDGFLELPADSTHFKAGTAYPFHSFRK